MSEKEKLSIGRELTDEELMEMTGGSSFITPISEKDIIIAPIVKYGIHCMYGINPIDPIVKPLYGIVVKPLYGIDIGR
ncbi:hypothetical protein [Acetivibrio clariflavus]|uniref:hypothetical protein n=1 Tax=Acetivibrio clariflavus TaxID=288965 RepID=UPI0004851E7C|nr:hypothetical protein [Acetivibrio clariflavus]